MHLSPLVAQSAPKSAIVMPKLTRPISPCQGSSIPLRFDRSLLAKSCLPSSRQTRRKADAEAAGTLVFSERLNRGAGHDHSAFSSVERKRKLCVVRTARAFSEM